MTLLLNSFFKCEHNIRNFLNVFKIVQARSFSDNYFVKCKVFQCNNKTESIIFKHLREGVPLSKLEKRFKHKKTKMEEESSSESEDEDEEISDLNDGSRIVKGYLLSLRADAVLKVGLGIARNKLETAFYENRIRVNGNKIPKKSFKVNIGDEVDIIKGENELNKSMLNISRIIVITAQEKDEEKILVKMRKYKNLVIENYNDLWINNN